MTSDQFSALAELLRSRHGPAESAARLVLVDGIKPAESARLTGVSPASVSNSVTRYKRALRLAQKTRWTRLIIAQADFDNSPAESDSPLPADDLAAIEREACAALCDWHFAHYHADWERTKQLTYKAASNAAQWLAKAIRARGQIKRETPE